MTSSGIPWDYRYQYLTGGVNTGEGWTTWNSPDGAFVDNYLRDSGDNGYIPVLTYYQIVASAPDPWSEDVSSSCRTRSTMNAYFSEWKLLMQKAGAYGRPVIVQVEPDMWGYMQQALRHQRQGRAGKRRVVRLRRSRAASRTTRPASRRRWSASATRMRPTSSSASTSRPGPPAST